MVLGAMQCVFLTEANW